jgi:hypothetical protein
MRTLIAVAAVALVGSTLSPAHAADHASATGLSCGFTSSDDPTGAVGLPGQQIGEVHGGPIAVAALGDIDDSSTPPNVTPPSTNSIRSSGSILCEIKVGGTGVYTDRNAVPPPYDWGSTVVYLPPTEINFFAASNDNVWFCTTWVLTSGDGTTDVLYLDDTTGNFVTDPATAHCALAIDQETSFGSQRGLTVFLGVPTLVSSYR